MLNEAKFKKFIDERFGGVLKMGSHPKNGEACALESLSAFQGRKWTDNPKKNDIYDIRPINDINVSDEVRIKHIVPVIVAYAGSRSWPIKKQIIVVKKMVILTVREIISSLPNIPIMARETCKNAVTVKDAIKATEAAGELGEAGRRVKAAARWVETAAEWGEEEWVAKAAAKAAECARSVAMITDKEAEWVWKAPDWEEAESAARAEAREKVFILACRVWTEAANNNTLFDRGGN